MSYSIVPLYLSTICFTFFSPMPWMVLSAFVDKNILPVCFREPKNELEHESRILFLL